MSTFRRVVVFFAFILGLSGLSSIVSASNPIPPGAQTVDSGTVTDYSNININGKKWEDVTAADLVQLLNAKIMQEQINTVTSPQNTSGTTPVTTTTDTNAPVNTSGSTFMGSNPIPPRNIFLKSVTNTH
jgi:hypothetical protein